MDGPGIVRANGRSSLIQSGKACGVFVEAVAAIDAKGRGVVEGERQIADIGGEAGGGVRIGAAGAGEQELHGLCGANTSSGTAAARPRQSGQRVVMSTCAPRAASSRRAPSAPAHCRRGGARVSRSRLPR